MAATTPVLNLTIFDSHNKKLMVLGDSSYYPTGYNIVNPTVIITVPGYGPKTLEFTERTINIYNSNDLGVTCDVETCDLANLPDGVYTIKYAIAPAYKWNTTNTFLRVDGIYAEFDEKFLNMQMFTCDGPLKRNQKLQLDEIEYYIQGAISAANRCATDLAIQLYNKANTLIKRFNPKCN
jgi:hypothetical protein